MSLKNNKKTLVGSSAKIKFDEVQKVNSFDRGFFYYLQQSYLVYECKIDSFDFDNKKNIKVEVNRYF